MPVHDWTRVDDGTFHAFHSAWTTHLMGALNRGLLPEGYYALAEQHSLRFVTDVLTLQTTEAEGSPRSSSGGVSVLEAPPRTRRQLSAQPSYKVLRRTVAIRHVSGHRIVALIEIVSPANKDRAKSVQEFVEKATDVVRHGCHLLVADLFPPGRHDPLGMHGAIWKWWMDEEDEVPAGEPLTLASYQSRPRLPIEVYLEHLAVGQAMPDMPLFLTSERYINVPLQSTYDAAFAEMPEFWRKVLDKGSNGRRKSKR
jgi:hypothetical protein